MCGISGYIGFKDGINDDSIKNTFKLMKNRGPDNYGLFSENIGNDKCIKLLHSRLSIIDLTLKLTNLNLWCSTLIFNGEIYNILN